MGKPASPEMLKLLADSTVWGRNSLLSSTWLSDGGNLPCQGKTGHRRPYPFGNQSDIEVLQRTRTCAGRDGSTFEKILQILVVVVIQTAQRDALAVALQFASHGAVLAAIVSLHGETAVGPELPLGTETMRCLQQGYEQSRANRTDGWNLAK